MALSILSLDQVNELISEHFIKIFGNIIEACPAAAICTLKYRPFMSILEICKAFDNFLDGLSGNEKQQILRRHQDFVSQLVTISMLEMDRPRKPRMISIENLTVADKNKLNSLNNRYKEKFGFPFVLYGKRSTSVVFNAMETRIENHLEREIEVAINEVKKICKLRIHEAIRR